MPEIPRLTTPTEKLNPLGDATTPTSVVSPDAYGARLWRDVGQLSAVVADTARVMQEREDTRRVFTAQATLTQRATERRTSYNGLLGVNAEGITARESEAWQKDFEEVSKDLTDYQRELLSRQVESFRLTNMEGISRHEQRQLVEATADGIKAAIGSANAAAAANANSPDVIAASRQTVEASARKLSELYGHNKETAEKTRADALDLFHAGVIRSLALGDNPVLAEQYYKTNSPEITNSRAEVEKLLKVTTQEYIVQSTANELLASGKPLPEILKLIPDKVPTTYRDAVASRVIKHMQMQEAAEKYEQQKAADEVLRRLNAGVSWPQIPKDLLARLSPEQYKVLAERAGIRIDNNASKLVLFSLYELVAKNPELFAELDLIGKYLPKMTDRDFHEIQQVQLAMRTKGAGADPAAHSAVTKADILQAAAKKYDLKDENLGKFHDFFNRALADLEAREGRKANAQDMQKVADAALMDLARFGTSRLYKNPAKIAGAKITVDDYWRAKMVQLLRSEGVPADKITDDVIVGRFKEYLANFARISGE